MLRVTAYRIQQIPPLRRKRERPCRGIARRLCANRSDLGGPIYRPGEKQSYQRELLKVVHDATSLQEVRAVLLPGDRLHPAVGTVD